MSTLGQFATQAEYADRLRCSNQSIADRAQLALLDFQNGREVDVPFWLHVASQCDPAKAEALQLKLEEVTEDRDGFAEEAKESELKADAAVSKLNDAHDEADRLVTNLRYTLLALNDWLADVNLTLSTKLASDLEESVQLANAICDITDPGEI